MYMCMDVPHSFRDMLRYPDDYVLKNSHKFEVFLMLISSRHNCHFRSIVTLNRTFKMDVNWLFICSEVPKIDALFSYHSHCYMYNEHIIGNLNLLCECEPGLHGSGCRNVELFPQHLAFSFHVLLDTHIFIYFRIS